MNNELIVLALWLLFGGTHIFLSLTPIRARLVHAFGEPGFVAFYVCVAAATFAILVHFYATHRSGSGDVVATLGSFAIGLGTIGAILGLILMCFCIVEYVHSPMAAFSEGVAEPTGMTRITRHSFLFGNVLFFGAHAAMARTPLDFIFFSGFVVLALFGAYHQDQKLLKRKGDAYRAFVGKTSLVPFAAVIAGRQTIVWSEINRLPIVIGIIASVVLMYFHDLVLAMGGLWFIIAMISVGIVETALAMRAHLLPSRRIKTVGVIDE